MRVKEIKWDGSIHLSRKFFRYKSVYNHIGRAIQFLEEELKRGLLFEMEKRRYVIQALSELQEVRRNHFLLLREIKKGLEEISCLLTSIRNLPPWDQQAKMLNINAEEIEKMIRGLKVLPFRNFRANILEPKFWQLKKALRLGREFRGFAKNKVIEILREAYPEEPENF